MDIPRHICESDRLLGGGKAQRPEERLENLFVKGHSIFSFCPPLPQFYLPNQVGWALKYSLSIPVLESQMDFSLSLVYTTYQL